MFPFDQKTEFHLLLTLIALGAAVAVQAGSRLRLLLLCAIFGLLAIFFQANPMEGDHAGLGYLIVVGGSTIAMVIGLCWGWLLRFIRSPAKASMIWVLAPMVALAVFIVWNQTVSPTCTEITARIGGREVALPVEMRPRLERGPVIGHFGRLDRKTDFARYCRQARTGSRVIEQDVIWLTPASNYKTLSARCGGENAPDWCAVYSSEPYRHAHQILIQSDPKRALSMPWWNSTSPRAVSLGDLTEGSLCLLPHAPGAMTECWVWRPFGEGFLISARSWGFDEVFRDLDPDSARAILHEGIDTALAIMLR
ncbi:MAG: hypothetical protein HKN18_03580 [Silicimonas sp.]|nr:hypothetical protein [Silicimonas sp.]